MQSNQQQQQQNAGQPNRPNMNPQQMHMMGQAQYQPQMMGGMMPQQMMQGQFNQGGRGRGGPMGGNWNQQMNMPNFPGMNMGPAAGGPPRQKPEYNNKLCLYIGNLSATTFDNDLFKFFKNKGYHLRNAQVMCNNDTRKSKQYGYLNFYTEDETKRCMQEQNNAIINGRNIVLNEKKNTDFDSAANILVKNLPREASFTQTDLFNLCQEFGKIVSCKLEVTRDNVSRGFGYVQFSSKDNAAAAIEKLNGKEHFGKEISVTVHSKKNEREDAGESFTNLFVKNIPASFSEDNMRALFAEFGEVQSVAKKGDGKDIGFVQFKTHEQAAAAIEALDAKKEIDGKVLFVSKFISQNDNRSNTTKESTIGQTMKETFKSNIFIRNIPKEVGEEEFRSEFDKAGKIISLKLKERNAVGTSELASKIGYVCYEEVRQAQKCIQLFDQTSPFGYGFRPLKVEFWQSKFDLIHENEEKNINQVKKFIHFIQHEMQQRPNTNQMIGYNQHYNMDANRGNNKFNNRGGRGGQRGGRGGQGRGGFNKNQNQPNQQQHFQSQAQNQVAANQAPQQARNPTPAGANAPQIQLPQIDVSQLDELSGPDRNNFVGNNIYAVIQQAYGEENAPRITGMLLDENAVNFKQLLGDSEYFRGKVNEAYILLMNSLQNQQKQ